MNISNDCNSGTEIINQQREGQLSYSATSIIETLRSYELPKDDLSSLECKNGVQGEKDFTLSWYNELLIVLSMVLYVVDIGTDINIAYNSHLIDLEYDEA